MVFHLLSPFLYQFQIKPHFNQLELASLSFAREHCYLRTLILPHSNN